MIADTTTLSTLPRRELSAALAEVVKHGVILDEGLFGEIEVHAGSLLDLEAGVLEPIIARSIQLKAQVVEQDEREAGIRAILNYGHTIGHAVEAVTEFAKYRHGEGVAIGLGGRCTAGNRVGNDRRSGRGASAKAVGAARTAGGLPGTRGGQAARGHGARQEGE